MLPFPKRKVSTEVELCDEDLVLVDDARASTRDADLAATVQRRRPTMPPSRRILDGDIEEDVAGQCLASIAAETSRDRDPYSSSQIRAVMMARPPRTAPPIEDLEIAIDLECGSRLPSVSPPPFVRTGHESAPGIRDSSPPSAFVRRSSPMLPVASASASGVASHLATHASAQSSERNTSSFAPVSMSERPAPPEPTVIVLRERPKAAWFIAAASLGALGAIAATRFLGAPVDDRAATPAAMVVAAPPALPPTNVVLPAARVAAAPVVATAAPVAVAPVVVAPPGPSAVVVHFGEDQGVAIKATPRGAAPAPARPVAPRGTTAPGGGVAPGNHAPFPRPGPARAPSMGPALPDGSFSLGRADNTPAPAPAASVAPTSTALALAPSPAPEPVRRRPLSAEQQLAEAQLKASMK